MKRNAHPNPSSQLTPYLPPPHYQFNNLAYYRAFSSSIGMTEGEIEVVIPMERAGSTQQDVNLAVESMRRGRSGGFTMRFAIDGARS